MATPRRPDTEGPDQPLVDAIVALAETPDHTRDLDARLTAIARLAVDRVAAADYASITTLQGDEYTTVATTSDIALAVDEAQFADGTGPCLQALESGEPVGVPDVSATMDWPHFHAVAPGLGLQASVSIPLYTGRGLPIAVLNMYGRDDLAMAPLIVAVADLYAISRELSLDMEKPPVSDPGAQELLDGYAQALAVRATIQLALKVLARQMGSSEDDAYTELCLRTTETGDSLSTVAATILQHQL